MKKIEIERDSVWFKPALKTLLTMKLIFLLVCGVGLLTSVAEKSYAQSTKLTFALKNTRIKDVLEYIENNSEFSFMYENNVVDVDAKVDVAANDETIDIILNRLLGDNTEYRVIGRHIVLFPSGPKPGETLSALIQQQPAVSGYVTDETGLPLPGVTVVVKGTTQGTVTNADGNYSIANIPENATLVFSFVGMRTQEVEVGKQSTINVVMMVDALGLDEVVVVGYGTTSRRKLTSAVTTINTSDLTELAYSNVTQSLQGKGAGIIVNNSGGEPGATGQISIRGGGEPLYVIDGVRMTAFEFNNLNPQDIESISFLKDAASTAVYGAEGGDGIIMVKTKEGKKGISATYSFNQQFSRPTVMPERLDAAEWMRDGNLAFEVEGLTTPFSEEIIQNTINQVDPYRYPNTNWRNLIYRNFAPETQHNLSLNGGGDKTSYYLSAGYFDQGSIYKTNKINLKRYNLNANFTTRFDEIGLKLGLNVNAAVRNKNEARESATTIGSWLEGADIVIHRAYNPDGTLADKWGSPLEVLDKLAGYNNSREKYTYVQLTADWDLPWFKGLHIGTLFNYKETDGFRKHWFAFAPQYTLDGIQSNPYGSKPSMKVYDIWDKNTYFQSYLNYLKLIGKHTIDAKFIYEFSEYYGESFDAYRRDYLSTAVDQLFAGSSQGKDNSGSAYEGGNSAYVGRLKYDYAAKYIMEFSFRYNGSDNFAPGHRWGFFPAGALAWVISDENFMTGLNEKNIINYMKIRASYGETGLAGDSRFPYLFTYSLNTNAYVFGGNLVNGFSEGNLVNPELMSWYARTALNYGLDFSTFGNRVDASVDYFYYRTSGYLMDPKNIYSTPLGKNLPQVNSESAHRRAGVEGNIYYNGKAGDFRYKVGLNFTHYQQLWERYDQEDSTQLLNPRKRITQVKDYGENTLSSLGFFQTIDEVINSPRPLASSETRPGDIAYKDINGDGKIDDEDNVRTGLPAFPHLMYGINFEVNYKSWNLSGLFQGTGDRYVMVGDRWRNHAAGNTAYKYQLDWWRPDNSDAEFPRHVTEWNANGQNNLRNSTQHMWNMKYFRLKNIQIGYNLKNGLFRNLDYISTCMISISGYNVLTFSKIFERIDPEAASFNYIGYPVQKTYALNFSIGF